MTVTRAAVLTAVADQSRPSPPRRTTVGELAAALDADCQTVGKQVAHLVDCGLVRRDDGDVRVTRVGAAVAAMDVEGVVVVVVGVDADSEQ